MLRTMTYSEIAAEIGVTPSSVTRRINDHDVAVQRDAAYHDKLLRKRQGAAKLAREARRANAEEKWKGFDVLEMAKTMTQAQIGQKVGVSQNSVSRRLARLRSQSEIGD